MFYRVRYKDARAGLGGDVRFSIQLDSSEDQLTWDPIEGGASELSLPAADLLAITGDPGLTAEQKLGAIHNLLLTQIQTLGITDAIDALQSVEALLPAGWPVTAAL